MERSSPLPRQDIRTIVAHDWLVTWAGAERCLAEILTVVPRPHVVASVVSHEVRGLNDVTRMCRETWLARIPGTRQHHRLFLPLELLAFLSLRTKDYDLVISSSHAFAKAIRSGKLGIHLSYCYSPPRYIWDLYDTYISRASAFGKAALRLARIPLQYVDRYAARRVTHFVAISRFVADRIKRHYNRVARVVYPPVSPKPGSCFTKVRREQFLLYLGRLVPYKRVDLLLRAADRLGVPMIIAGGGPDSDRLKRLAGRTAQFLGEVDEVTAGDLLNRCACFVFAAEEDFGIAPLEANAHGAPVVAFAGGAARETMISGVTAEFFDSPTVESAMTAIHKALDRSWSDKDLRANAERFSPQRFRESFSEVLEAALGGERW